MIYLSRTEKVTPEAIAKSFDRRSEVKSGYLEGRLVFQVSVWGEVAGCIVPPAADGGIWGVNLSLGAHEVARLLSADPSASGDWRSGYVFF